MSGILMKQKTFVLVVVLCFISSIFLSQMSIVKSSDENPVVVWFVGDPHYEITRHGDIVNQNTNTRFETAVNQTNELGALYAFVLGDMVDDANSTEGWKWDNFHNVYDTLDVIYKNYIIGNHDWNWDLFSRLPQLNYTYQIGNVLLIIIGDEDTATGGTTGSGSGQYGNQLQWLNNTVQSNSDKNIFILSHHQPKRSINPDSEYTGFIEYIENHPEYHIDAWLYGHHHYHNQGDDPLVTYVNNIHMFNVGCTYNGYLPPSNNATSTYWYFTNSSSQVTVKWRNHCDDVFESYKQYPYQFDLTYSFQSDVEPDFGFISIQGQQNNTFTFDVIRDFNWAAVDDTLYYHLQIANDSEFTDTFVNLRNINASNYPMAYSEAGGYVEFVLPEEYRKEWYQEYYFRFRAYVHDDTS